MSRRSLTAVILTFLCIGAASCQPFGDAAAQNTPKPQISVTSSTGNPHASIEAGADSWEFPLQWQVADSFVTEDGKAKPIHGHKTKRVIVPVSLTTSDGTVVQLHFLVDTGADQTVVNTERVHADLKNAAVQDVEGVGGLQKTYVVTVPRLAVGPLAEENAQVAFASMPVEQDGLLGQDFLKHFSVTIDYQKAVFRLERAQPKERAHAK